LKHIYIEKVKSVKDR